MRPVADADSDDERLVLSELLNLVLDKGLVVSGSVTISIADIDLVRVGLTLSIAGVERETRRQSGRAGTVASGGRDASSGEGSAPDHAGVPVLPPSREG
jgi:hypothetical protein